MAHDKGLSTSIGWRNKDAYGRQIPHKSRAQIYRLRKWQHRIRTSKSGERSLAQGLTEINTMASKMGLPRHVRESAAVLYRRASTKNLVRGRSIEEVAEVAGVTEVTIRNRYKRISVAIGMVK